MAKIILSKKVTLDIVDNGEKIDSFNVTFKPLNKKQEKELGDDSKKIMDINTNAIRLRRQIELLERKAEALSNVGDDAGVIKISNELEKLYKESDKLEKDFDDLGGFDLLTNASKRTFELAVGGEDKDRLQEWIEENSDYSEVLSAIAEDANKGKREK
jgi:hypothetical protein